MGKTKSGKGLQMIMTAASLVGFLGGWALLGHAPKPGAVAQTVPVTLTTESSTRALRPSQLQASSSLLQLPAQSIPSSQSTGLRLRTGGS
jgi:hypothetical protein